MAFFTKPLVGSQLDYSHSLTRGLIAHWPFNEKAGSMVNDISLGGKSPGLSDNMTNDGVTSGWSGSEYGGSLRFDGTDDYVAINNNLVLQQYIDYNLPFSIFFSFRIRATTYGRIIGNEFYVGANGSAWFVDVDTTNGIYFGIINIGAGPVQDGRIYRAASVTTSMNQTYNYVVTYDGLNTTTSCKIYRRGIPQTVNVQNDFGNASGTIWSSDNLAQATTIGARINYPTPGSIDTEFLGIIEDIKIWNRVLTDQDAKIICTYPYCIFKQNKRFSILSNLIRNWGQIFG